MPATCYYEQSRTVATGTLDLLMTLTRGLVHTVYASFREAVSPQWTCRKVTLPHRGPGVPRARSFPFGRHQPQTHQPRQTHSHSLTTVIRPESDCPGCGASVGSRSGRQCPHVAVSLAVQRSGSEAAALPLASLRQAGRQEPQRHSKAGRAQPDLVLPRSHSSWPHMKRAQLQSEHDKHSC